MLKTVALLTALLARAAAMPTQNVLMKEEVVAKEVRCDLATSTLMYDREGNPDYCDCNRGFVFDRETDSCVAEVIVDPRRTAPPPRDPRGPYRPPVDTRRPDPPPREVDCSDMGANAYDRAGTCVCLSGFVEVDRICVAECAPKEVRNEDGDCEEAVDTRRRSSTPTRADPEPKTFTCFDAYCTSSGDKPGCVNGQSYQCKKNPHKCHKKKRNGAYKNTALAYRAKCESTCGECRA